MTGPDATRRPDRAARAVSFERGAATYALARPGYPAAVVDWALDGVAPGVGAHRLRVLDLAAGTGRLTERLVEHGTDVTAVDPSPAMLRELAGRLPDVEAHVGTAEHVPVPDGAFDAVLVATAWHWFDEVAAGREVARVLRPGGRLAVLRNDRDSGVPWLAAFGEILHRGDALQRPEESFDPRPGDAFGRGGRTEVTWSDTVPTAGLRALAASRSHLLALPAAERDALLDDVDRLAATHPGLAGRATVELPYRTRGVRFDLRPA